MRNTVVMIVLAILAAATWVATWQRQAVAPAVERIERCGAARLLHSRSALLGTDEHGRVTYRVVAERLDELPGDERLQLTGVEVDYQSDGRNGLGHVRCHRERREGRLAARPRRQRRGPQLRPPMAPGL